MSPPIYCPCLSPCPSVRPAFVCIDEVHRHWGWSMCTDIVTELFLSLSLSVFFFWSSSRDSFDLPHPKSSPPNREESRFFFYWNVCVHSSRAMMTSRRKGQQKFFFSGACVALFLSSDFLSIIQCRSRVVIRGELGRPLSYQQNRRDGLLRAFMVDTIGEIDSVALFRPSHGPWAEESGPGVLGDAFLDPRSDKIKQRASVGVGKKKKRK